jgi:hypothetical protein
MGRQRRRSPRTETVRSLRRQRAPWPQHWRRPAAPLGGIGRGEGVRLRRVDAFDLEPLDSVVLGPVIVLPKGQLRLAADTGWKRVVELGQRRDAELTEVALRHRHRGRREVTVVPESPPGVLAHGDAEGQPILGLPLAGRIQHSLDHVSDVLAPWQGRELLGGFRLVEGFGQFIAIGTV